MTAVAGTRIAVDRDLLKFTNHEQYLDSLVTPDDIWYLKNSELARQVAELGYRSTGETITKRSFQKRSQIVKNLLHPIYRPYVLNSESKLTNDSLQRELALRERSNRIGTISTIIHVRQSTRFNYEISCYMDYADRLIVDDWQSFFDGKQKIRPRKNDLSYHDWRTGKSYLNATMNYRPSMDEKRGLMFKNLHDGKYISVDPWDDNPGIGSTRVRVKSDQYEHIVLYDHAVR